jgi:hypothetical protein
MLMKQCLSARPSSSTSFFFVQTRQDNNLVNDMTDNKHVTPVMTLVATNAGAGAKKPGGRLTKNQKRRLKQKSAAATGGASAEGAAAAGGGGEDEAGAGEDGVVVEYITKDADEVLGDDFKDFKEVFERFGKDRVAEEEAAAAAAAAAAAGSEVPAEVAEGACVRARARRGGWLRGCTRARLYGRGIMTDFWPGFAWWRGAGTVE